MEAWVRSTPPADSSAKKIMTILPILAVRNRVAAAYRVIGGDLPEVAPGAPVSLADATKRGR